MDTWLTDFDAALTRRYAIDHRDAGMDAQQLARYRDLEPARAAEQFGEDYDLERVDTGWR